MKVWTHSDWQVQPGSRGVCTREGDPCGGDRRCPVEPGGALVPLGRLPRGGLGCTREPHRLLLRGAGRVELCISDFWSACRVLIQAFLGQTRGSRGTPSPDGSWDILRQESCPHPAAPAHPTGPVQCTLTRTQPALNLSKGF